MRFVTKENRLLTLIGAVALAGILLAAPWSFKPAAAFPPGGGGGNAPTGVIYFTFDNLLWFMIPDGSEKTALLPGVSGEPSAALHGGSRWFLNVAADGLGINQLFAVDENAVSVQLTFGAAVSGSVRWAVDGATADGAVSWQQADGIYRAQMVYDGGGGVMAIGPPALIVPGSDIESHGWAPSGTSLVYRTSGDRLNVVDDVNDPANTTRTISTEARRSPAGHSPAWSPDGTKIAFQIPYNVIVTINPDGTGLKEVINPTPTTSRNDATWSPTGSHLMYLWSDNFNFAAKDVYIAKANGKSKANLTADLEGPARPVAWREGPGAGGSGVCGDGVLDPGETPCTCPEDAGDPPPNEVGFCHDGIDNDCDGFIDCADATCGDPYPSCPIQLCEVGAGWIQEDGGCKDPVTGLVWSLPVSGRNWNFAAQFADELIEGGESDWRLPTKAELETAAAHLILDKLTTTRIWVWSSTRNRNEIWWVALNDGSSGSSPKASGIPFYCVRESQP